MKNYYKSIIKLLFINVLIVFYYSKWSSDYFKFSKAFSNLSLFYSEKSTTRETRMNGCIIFLLRNNDLSKLVNLIKRIELVFNSNWNYPYILFNDEPFTTQFKNEIVKHTNSTVEFGLIPSNEWNVPEWIDRAKLNKSIKDIGHSVSYRQMCRFNSGFFFRNKYKFLLVNFQTTRSSSFKKIISSKFILVIQYAQIYAY